MQMVEEIHPEYDLYQMFLSPSDTGHDGTARERTYVIASHTEKTSCKQDPHDLRDAISKKMQKKVKTQAKDYFFAEPWEVSMEAMACINRQRGVWTPVFNDEGVDLRRLLSSREQQALAQYEKEYVRRYSCSPSRDKNLVCYLADNPSWSLTWSAVSGRIPTLRLNSHTGKLWIPSLNRWMVGRERLATLGWPVNSDMATAMGVKEVPAKDYLRSCEMAGNGMHLPCVAVAELIALSCFGPLSI